MPRTTRTSAAPSEPAAPAGCTNLKLRQITRQVSRLYDAEVTASGLKTTQYSLLSHVVALEPVRPSDLASHMRMEPSTLTRNLQPLIAAGLVEQGPGENARSRLVTATSAGREKRTEARKAWKHAQESLNQSLGTDRVARLHALIDECLDILGTPPEGSSDE